MLSSLGVSIAASYVSTAISTAAEGVTKLGHGVRDWATGEGHRRQMAAITQNTEIALAHSRVELARSEAKVTESYAEIARNFASIEVEHQMTRRHLSNNKKEIEGKIIDADNAQRAAQMNITQSLIHREQTARYNYTYQQSISLLPSIICFGIGGLLLYSSKTDEYHKIIGGILGLLMAYLSSRHTTNSYQDRERDLINSTQRSVNTFESHLNHNQAHFFQQPRADAASRGPSVEEVVDNEPHVGEAAANEAHVEEEEVANETPTEEHQPEHLRLN